MNKSKPEKAIKFYHDTGKWGFLSPMYICSIKIDGIIYKSAEHYYQSMKIDDMTKREWIRDSETGYRAKERAHTLRPGELASRSSEGKVAIMRMAFIAKFIQNKELGDKLLATGNTMLFEDSPDDPFWGITGENWIGKLAMEARAAVQKERI